MDTRPTLYGLRVMGEKNSSLFERAMEEESASPGTG